MLKTAMVSQNKKGKGGAGARGNFWLHLKKPIFAVAPMSDVTDEPFRMMIAKYSRMGKAGGGPDVMWTEFISADGLCSIGKERLMHILKFTEKERPIVAQIFSANPAKIKEACEIIESLGFDGIDINMGCPDKSVEKQGAGAGLIKTPALAREIIRSAKAGVKNIPISVKTRIGYNKPEVEEWLSVILEEGVSALTVHARTRKELSDFPAQWSFVKKAVELRDKISPDTIILGNGDVKSLKEANEKVAETGADGVMIGRGLFGTPWFFDSELKEEPGPEKRLKIMLEHAKLFEKILSKDKPFDVMKKHFKAYVNGWEGARELRIKLMECDSSKDLEKVVEDYSLKDTCILKTKE
ncbi:MAG: tRNA-dihydrouridine synthase [bacterium]